MTAFNIVKIYINITVLLHRCYACVGNMHVRGAMANWKIHFFCQTLCFFQMQLLADLCGSVSVIEEAHRETTQQIAFSNVGSLVQLIIQLLQIPHFCAVSDLLRL